MWVTISNWSLPLEAHERPWDRLIADRLGCRPDDVAQWRIRRRSVDARKKPHIRLVFSVDARLNCSAEWVHRLCEKDSGVALVGEAPREELLPGQRRLRHRPVVVGFGPAGIFCALRLADYGFRPIVLEQGQPVETRALDVKRFWHDGILDASSNVQFGEGGAGAFSDGKLMTRIKDPRTQEILEHLVEAGGPEEILYEQRPHIGTDQLRPVVARLRECIIQKGGEVRFGVRVDRLAFENGRISALILSDGTEVAADVAFLAVGNSGREIFSALAEGGLTLQPKAFAIGLRVEHPQERIDSSQYGTAAGHPALGHAEYRLAFHHPPTGRSVYSFCMCPGGSVIAATSEKGAVVTNGMSLHARDSGVANSAIVATVTPDDFESKGPLAGVEFQRQWENAAFRAGGADYFAPAQTMGSFLGGGRPEEPRALRPSYRPGTRSADLNDCLPDFVSSALRDAMRQFERQIRGFADPGAVLTGVETRTSSPVRIVRNERGQAPGFEGTYPIGEGAGYAGGIISAALDGWIGAGAVIREYARPCDRREEAGGREE